MAPTFDPRATGHLVDQGQLETLSLMGPTIQVLTPLTEDSGPCLMRGMIPPGVVIPIHAHPDPESFFILAGEVEGLAYPCSTPTWVTVASGELFHAPGQARHAWRNLAQEPAEMLVVTTAKMARFFREVGVPAQEVTAGEPPSPAVLKRFQEVSARYGYWNATPEENAEAGIELAFG